MGTAPAKPKLHHSSFDVQRSMFKEIMNTE